MFKLHSELGRHDVLEASLARALADDPAQSVMRSMLALAHAELGEHGLARREFDALALNEFTSISPGLWSATLAYLGETVVLLGEVQRAATVYSALAPYTGQVVANGLAVHCPGAVDRYLGQLAATLGNFNEAADHYDVAVALETRLRSPPLLARTRYWYGRMRVERSQGGDLERANELLTSSLETAEQLGMAGLATQARALLERT